MKRWKTLLVRVLEVVLARAMLDFLVVDIFVDSFYRLWSLFVVRLFL